MRPVALSSSAVWEWVLSSLTYWTASAGSPALATAARQSSAMASHEAAAAEPPLRTQALPERRQRASASAVTLGRASKMTATVPSGTVTFSTERPLLRTCPERTRPSGSGWPATSSMASAIAATRSGVRARRSWRGRLMPSLRSSLEVLPVGGHDFGFAVTQRLGAEPDGLRARLGASRGNHRRRLVREPCLAQCLSHVGLSPLLQDEKLVPVDCGHGGRLAQEARDDLELRARGRAACRPRSIPRLRGR